MCTTDGESSLDLLDRGLTALIDTDVTGASDHVIRAELLALLAAANKVSAAIMARVASFDTRDLAPADGQRSTRAWLRGFGRMSPYAASALLDRAQLLRQLPKLAAAAGAGRISPEHIGKVVALAEQVGIDHVRSADKILADLAGRARPDEVEAACARIRAHVDPDGPDPDPDAFQRRGFTMARQGSLMMLRGRLDPEGGAALATALDALMRPPSADEPLTAAQRRADALTELARLHLRAGTLPMVGGTRPQIGVLIPAPAGLFPTPPAAAPAQPANHGAEHGTAADHGTSTEHRTSTEQPGPDSSAKSFAATVSRLRSELTIPAQGHGDPLSNAGIRLRPEPPYLDWFGPIPDTLAQRLSCDSDVWRAVFDPATGQPLDVGRAHRVAPHWIRKALHARDRGCRWPACPAPTPWTDAHHLQHWMNGGTTALHGLVLLCRWHHMLVHEGQWRIELDPSTGELHVYRPDGSPYELGPSQPHTGPLRQ